MLFMVLPPPTDPNDRPRPKRHRGLPRRRSRRPALRPRRKVRKPYPLRFRKGEHGSGEEILILRPDPLDRDWLADNPDWRATLRRVIRESR